MTKIKYSLLLFCAILISNVVSAQPHFAVSDTPYRTDTLRGDSLLQVIRALGLPVIRITTTDGENPTSEDIEHPEGLYGYSITNKVAKTGRMEIFRGDSLWYDSGEYQAKSSGIKLKHRGNTSAYYSPNKPFKLSLQQKADLMVKQPGDTTNRKDKDWVLLNCTNNIKALIGQQVAISVGMEYVPRMEPVNVILNDDYHGIYLLAENITRNPDCRINVDKKDGYIIEYDCYFWNETFSIPSSLASTRQWTMKYPDSDDLSVEQSQQIAQDIVAFENAVNGSEYDTIFDTHSFARWLLAHDILASSDGGGTNPFIARTNHQAGSLLRMPALWDFDSSLSNANSWSATHSRTYFVFGLFFNNTSTNAFTEAYIAEWDTAHAHQVFDHICQYLTQLPQSEIGLGLQASLPYHVARWDKNAIPTIKQQAADAIAWFTQHEEWMTNQIQQLRNTIPTSLFHMDNSECQPIRKIQYNNRLYIQREKNFFDIFGRKISYYDTY